MTRPHSELPDSDAIREITKTMFPPFPTVRADLGIVLGAGIATPFVIRRAAELLRERAFGLDHLILCGGGIINDLSETGERLPLVKDLLFSERLALPRDGETEAHYMARYLERSKVLESHFTIEDESTNTKENLANARRTNIFRKARDINLIGLLPTRALMTFRKQEVKQKCAPKIMTLTNVIPFKEITPDNWHQFPEIAAFILAEYHKIDPQNPKNYITGQQCLKINLDKEILCANALLLPHSAPRRFATPNHASSKIR